MNKSVHPKTIDIILVFLSVALCATGLALSISGNSLNHLFTAIGSFCAVLFFVRTRKR